MVLASTLCLTFKASQLSHSFFPIKITQKNKECGITPAVVSKRGVDGNQKGGTLSSRQKRDKFIIPQIDKVRAES